MVAIIARESIGVTLRYLGTQGIDDHKTFVLGFAQIPNRVKVPGKYKWAGKEVPFFFQGIAWIDQSTFDVVRLRTDLLSPIPSVNLKRMTTELRFRSVRIHGFGAVLWLPSEVLIRTARSDSIFEEIHQYSGYSFFHAESKLLPRRPTIRPCCFCLTGRTTRKMDASGRVCF